MNIKKLLIILLLSGCASNYEDADKPLWIDKQAAVVAVYDSEKVRHYKVEIYPSEAERKFLVAGSHQPTTYRLFRSLDKICQIKTVQEDLRKGWKYEYELFNTATDKLVSRIFYTAKECDIEGAQAN